MTNEQILTIIISATVSAVVSSFAKPFMEKILAAIMPDTKKVASFMKKLLFFILRYGPASFWIIRLLVLTNLPFDKFWVLQFCLQFLILGVIISFDISYYFINNHIQITNEQLSVIKSLAETTGEHKKVLVSLTETAEKQLGLTEKVIALRREENNSSTIE